MTRYRCPVCLVMFCAPGALCTGGCPIYDPQAPVGARLPVHEARLVVDERSDLSACRDRKPFAPTGMPYLVRVEFPGELPVAFGPFPTFGAADRFVADRPRMFGYSIDVMFPPGDADHLRR